MYARARAGRRLVLLRALLNGGGVEQQVRVDLAALRQIAFRALIFIRDGADEHDARRGLAVVGFAQRVDDPGVEFGLEIVHLARAVEGFVVAERGEDDVDFLARQVLRHGGEVVRTRLQIHLVRRPGEVSDHELVIGMRELDQRLDVAKLLRTIQQRVADEGNARAFFQLQRQRRFHGRRAFGIRRRRIRRPAIRPTGSPARIPNRADFAGNNA